MSTFHCWSPRGFGHNEDEGKSIKGDSPKDAAETWAEEIFYQGDPFTEIDIHVRVDDSTVMSFEVMVEYSPYFYAHKERELQSNVKPDRDTSWNFSQENPDAQDDVPPVLGETGTVPAVPEPSGDR